MSKGTFTSDLCYSCSVKRLVCMDDVKSSGSDLDANGFRWLHWQSAAHAHDPWHLTDRGHEPLTRDTTQTDKNEVAGLFPFLL
eukprot:1420493-Amphidinium_carterae.1